MAACGSLGPITIESEDLWKQIKSFRDVGQSPSFKQIFGELQHFKDKNHNLFQNPTESSSPSCPPPSKSVILGDDKNGNSDSNQDCPTGQKRQYRHSDSFSSMNSDNLSICTEGLGVESFDDVDDLFKNDILRVPNNEHELHNTISFTRNISVNESQWGELRRSKTCTSQFPPPISCIGKCGTPFVRFKSYRQDGRFILKEIRIPELLQARRENGRLRLNLIQSDDDDDEDNDDVDIQGGSDWYVWRRARKKQNKSCNVHSS